MENRLWGEEGGYSEFWSVCLDMGVFFRTLRSVRWFSECTVWFEGFRGVSGESSCVSCWRTL